MILSFKRLSEILVAICLMTAYPCIIFFLAGVYSATYQFRVKETLSFLVPIHDKQIELYLFLPKGYYAVSLAGGSSFLENTLICGNIIISDNIVDTMHFSYDVTDVEKKRINNNELFDMYALPRRSNPPFPWTHLIKDIFPINEKSLVRFNLKNSQYIKIHVKFNNKYSNIYLKIESIIKG